MIEEIKEGGEPMRDIKEAGVNRCFYISEEQLRWVNELARANNESASWVVRLAIKKLQELVEGVPDE